MGNITLNIIEHDDGTKSINSSWTEVDIVDAVKACGLYLGRHLARDASKVGTSNTLTLWLIAELLGAVEAGYEEFVTRYADEQAGIVDED